MSLALWVADGRSRSPSSAQHRDRFWPLYSSEGIKEILGIVAEFYPLLESPHPVSTAALVTIWSLGAKTKGQEWLLRASVMPCIMILYHNSHE